MTRFGAIGRRGASYAFPILDQVFSAVSMLLVTSAAARSLTVADFGRFAIVQLVVASCLVIFRQVPGSWILVRGESSRTESRDGILTGLLLGLPASSACIVLSILIGGGALSLMLWLSLLLLFHFSHDSLRLLLLAQQKRARACAISLLLLIGASVGYAFSVLGLAGATSTLVGYLAVLMLTTVCGLGLFRAGLSLTNVGSYIRASSTGWRSQAAAAIVQVVPTAATPIAVALGGGPGAVGAIRGAQSVNGLPLQVVQGLLPVFLARASREYRQRGRVPVRNYLAVVAAQMTSIVGFALVLSVTPDAVMSAVLGDSWGPAKSVVFILLASATFGQLHMILEIHSRVVGGLGRFVAATSPLVACSVVLAGVGAVLGGSRGAALAILVCSALRAVSGLVAVATYGRRTQHDE